MDRLECDTISLFLPSTNSKNVQTGYKEALLEEDGLLRETKPLIQKTNTAIMKDRFFTQEKQNWLDSNGQLLQADVPGTKPIANRYEDDHSVSPSTIFYPLMTKENMKNLEFDKEETLILFIHLKELRFLHHYNFTKEHEIAAELRQEYELYEHRKTYRIADIHTERLKVLRNTLKKLHSRARNADAVTITDELDFKHKTELYRREIKVCRENGFSEEKETRRLILAILRLWNRLKGEREAAGGRWATPLDLVVRKGERELKADSRRWNEQLMLEVDEIIAEEQTEWDGQMAVYRHELQKWKAVAKDSQGTKTIKPAKPQPIDKEKIAADVKNRFIISKRPVGEPEISLELVNTRRCPTEGSVPSTDGKGTNTKKSKYLIKVLINNKAVTATPPSVMDEDFRISFTFPIFTSLLSWPRDLRLDLVEKRAMNRTAVVATSVIALPKGIVDNVPFAATVTFGSSKNAEKETNTIKATLSVDICRRTNLSDSIDNPAEYNVMRPTKSFEPKKESVDPNDPRSVPVCETLVTTQQESHSGTFSLSPNEFCSSDVIDCQARLKALRLRFEGDPDYRDLRFIPSLEEEMLKKPLSDLDSQSEDGKTRSSASDSIQNARKIDAERLVCSLFRRIDKVCGDSNATPDVHDIVREEEVPNISTIAELLSIFKPYRPLRPERKKRSQLKNVAMTTQNSKLLVHVSRALYVPRRSDANSFHRRSEEISSEFTRPYVEVSFQRSTARTVCSKGSSPTWNEQLSLPFRPPNGDLSSLGSIEDVIYIHLFDEVRMDETKEESRRNVELHQRIENRWLGSLKIPFSTLHVNNKIEGTFPMQAAVVCLGYTQSETVKNPHLTLYLTFEPPLPRSEMEKYVFKSLEESEHIESAAEWVKSLQCQFPNRFVRTHAIDMSAKLVSLNRFIRALAPPAHIVDSECEKKQKLLNVLWYVSLLPSLATMQQLNGIIVLANSEQFVSFGTGGEEERAILLTNYLLFLGFDAHVLIGYGIPRGLSFFVLTKLSQKWKILIPSSVSIIDAADATSPITAVYMVITHDNMYANIQKLEDPPHLDFDLSDDSNWKAFYGKSLKDPGLTSVQPRSVPYPPADHEGVKDLQEKLALILRDAFMKWRPMYRTTWNRHANKVMQRLIPSFEAARMNGETVRADFKPLSAIMKSYKVCGVCIHLPYSTAAAVIEAVYGTGLHRCTIPGAQFAIAVEGIAYPANVASIWIYVASLVQRP